MKVLTDLLPILLFFIVYKIAGIYAATWAAMAAAVGQFAFYKLVYKRVEAMSVITMVLILVLGGATLLLHNQLFIKWKPTAIDWAFALAFIGSRWTKKTLMQRMLENNIQLPINVWQRLNSAWAGFFAVMGAANLYVVYHYSTDVWVNFKLFGMLGLTVCFVIVQSFYIAKHIKPEPL